MYRIYNLTDLEATLIEPAACAIHGMDKLSPPVGVEVLLLGAGPTGIILSQLLKVNGASKVVLAANKGIKMDIARKLDAADVYVELDRENPESQWKKLKEDNPYGFDIVVRNDKHDLYDSVDHLCYHSSFSFRLKPLASRNLLMMLLIMSDGAEH